MIPIAIVEHKILLLRGQKVILGVHLAELYDVETRALMQAVKRNRSRFPHDFMFELTREEIRRISQIVTSLKYAKTAYAFTEEGVAMLSSVLSSDRAVHVNIAIMRAFVKLRELLATNRDLAKRLDDLEKKYDTQFKIVFDAIRELMTPPQLSRKEIGFRVREKSATYHAHGRKELPHA
jgi:hypothetical protein